MKICNICKVKQPLINFYRSSDNLDGRRGDCKSCKNKSTLKWRTKNRKKVGASPRRSQRN